MNRSGVFYRDFLVQSGNLQELPDGNYLCIHCSKKTEQSPTYQMIVDHYRRYHKKFDKQLKEKLLYTQGVTTFYAAALKQVLQKTLR